MPRRNAEVVVIQVFSRESRNVGSDARSVRYAGLRVGTGVRDDNVEKFAHVAEREEDVPTTTLLRQRQAGSDFNSEQILAVWLLIDAIAISGDGTIRTELLDDVVDVLNLWCDSMRDPLHLPCLSRSRIGHVFLFRKTGPKRLMISLHHACALRT